jgi:hypothetical protein
MTQLPGTAPQPRHPAEAVLQGAHLSAWQTVDSGLLPLLTQAKSPPDFTLDASNPAHLYATVSTGSFGITVYVTDDAGASWHAVLSVPTAKRVALWSADKHQVFLEVLSGQDAPYQLFYSRDGGSTWHGVGLHYHGGGEPLFVSPQGRIVTFTEVTLTSLEFFLLDPVTGGFSSLGVYTFDTGGPSIGAVVDGRNAQFIFTSYSETDVLPLPRQ